MKYGERLRAAREHAKLSQSALAAKAEVGTQENVSKLERGEAEGSEFTVQYARACGVRPEWLALEDGSMGATELGQDQRIITALKIMQELPNYAVDIAIKEIASIAQLIQAAKADVPQAQTLRARSPSTRKKQGS